MATAAVRLAAVPLPSGRVEERRPLSRLEQFQQMQCCMELLMRGARPTTVEALTGAYQKLVGDLYQDLYKSERPRGPRMVSIEPFFTNTATRMDTALAARALRSVRTIFPDKAGGGDSSLALGLIESYDVYVETVHSLSEISNPLSFDRFLLLGTYLHAQEQVVESRCRCGCVYVSHIDAYSAKEVCPWCESMELTCECGSYLPLSTPKFRTRPKCTDCRGKACSTTDASDGCSDADVAAFQFDPNEPPLPPVRGEQRGLFTDLIDRAAHGEALSS